MAIQRSLDNVAEIIVNTTGVDSAVAKVVQSQAQQQKRAPVRTLEEFVTPATPPAQAPARTAGKQQLLDIYGNPIPEDRFKLEPLKAASEQRRRKEYDAEYIAKRDEYLRRKAEEDLIRREQQGILMRERGYRVMQHRLLMLNMGILGVNMSLLGLQWTLKKIPGLTKQQVKAFEQVASSIQFVASMLNMLLSIAGVFFLFRSVRMFGWYGAMFTPGFPQMPATPPSSVYLGSRGGGGNTIVNNYITSSSPTYVERNIVRSIRLAKG